MSILYTKIELMSHRGPSLPFLHSVSKHHIPSIGIRRASTTVDGASAVDSINQLTGIHQTLSHLLLFSGPSLELRGAALELLGAPRPRRCALCASSDAEHRGAHEVLRRLPVHEFGHCVWRAICRVLENPLHGLSENQAPRWPMRICAVLIPCLLEPLPIVGLLSELRATRSSTSMRFLP